MPGAALLRGRGAAREHAGGNARGRRRSGMLPPGSGERLLLPQPRPQRPAERCPRGQPRCAPAPGPARIQPRPPRPGSPAAGPAPPAAAPPAASQHFVYLCPALTGGRSGAGRAGKCSSREHRGTAGARRGQLPGQWLCVPAPEGVAPCPPRPRGGGGGGQLTESQSGSRWEGPRWVSSQLRSVTPEHSVQDCIQMALEHLQ